MWKCQLVFLPDLSNISQEDKNVQRQYAKAMQDKKIEIIYFPEEAEAKLKYFMSGQFLKSEKNQKKRRNNLFL